LTFCWKGGNNITMKKTKKQEAFCKQLLAQNITCELPEFDSLYNHIKPIIPAIQDALDYGHQQAQLVLKTQKQNRMKDERLRKIIDQQVYSHIIRYAAQIYLNMKDIEARYEEINGTSDWDIKVLPNNGLKGIWDGRSYRIFKGRNGQLPSLGISKVMQEFYRQGHLSQLVLLPPNNKPKRYNVAFLWDIHPKNYVNLYLCCPRYWVNHKAYDYFTRLLRHPAEVITPSIVEAEDIEREASEARMRTIKQFPERLI
jgi:hypothetical protein